MYFTRNLQKNVGMTKDHKSKIKEESSFFYLIFYVNYASIFLWGSKEGI